jgi:hypothetical protein
MGLNSKSYLLGVKTLSQELDGKSEGSCAYELVDRGKNNLEVGMAQSVEVLLSELFDEPSQNLLVCNIFVLLISTSTLIKRKHIIILESSKRKIIGSVQNIF